MWAEIRKSLHTGSQFFRADKRNKTKDFRHQFPKCHT